MAGKAITIRDYRTVPGGLTTPSTWTFPTVQSRNSHGRVTEWTLSVRALAAESVNKTGAELEAAFVPLEAELDNKPSANYGYIVVRSGVVGGKVRDVVPTIVQSGKNLKSTAATNPFCQALRDALGLYTKQCRKVAEVAADAAIPNTRYPPMLAQVANLEKLDWTKRMWIQRKYNGVRAVATLENDAVVLYSRTRIAYPGLDSIKAELLPVLREMREQDPKYANLFLDGELYEHGKSLNEISGKVRGGTADSVVYNVYDMFIPNVDMKYSERRGLVSEIVNCAEGVFVALVDTYEAQTHANVLRLYRQFRDEKYEGAMLRLDAPYKFSYNGHHCKHLLKIKPELDDEYEIIGWHTGEKGKAANALMLRCTVGDGLRRTFVDNGHIDVGKLDPKDREFNVTPMGTIEDRIKLAAEMPIVQANGKTKFENEWLGKRITVYFAELSPYGLPQQGRTQMEIIP